MKIRFCQTCGKPLEDGVFFCPHCAAESPPSAENIISPLSILFRVGSFLRRNWKKAAVIVAACILLALVVFFSLNDYSNGPHPGVFPGDSTGVSSLLASSYETRLPSASIASSAPASIQTTTALSPTQSQPLPTYDPKLWYIEAPQYLDYREFFATERIASQGANTLNWTSPEGTVCTLQQNCGLHVLQNNATIYTVPDSEALTQNLTLLYTDGHVAYLQSTTELLQINLLTGELKAVYTAKELITCQFLFPEMCYLVEETDTSVSLCRLHIPSLTLDVLYDGIPARTPRSWLFVTFPDSTQGTVSWEGISPEMVDALYLQFQNPESPYYPDFGYTQQNLSDFWENPELIRQLDYSLVGSTPMMKLQEDLNLQALWKGAYSIADGTVTQDWGVVDTCWFGSGMNHDHWNPELTQDIPLTVLNSTPTPITSISAPTAEMVEIILQSPEIFKYEPYIIKDHVVHKLQDTEYIPVPELPLAQSYWTIQDPYYTYYLTQDNQIIRLDADGNAVTVYNADGQSLNWLCYSKGVLAFVQEHSIMLLDTINCTLQELATHPGRIYIYFDSDTTLYIDTTLGLAIHSYLLDFATGSLEETNYRL